MKTRLRVFSLALIALMTLPLVVQAQEDVTALYLRNPSFEEGTYPQFNASGTVPGWDVTDFSCAYQNNDADEPRTAPTFWASGHPPTLLTGNFPKPVDSVLVPAGTLRHQLLDDSTHR
jgi:hypothetical protein